SDALICDAVFHSRRLLGGLRNYRGLQGGRASGTMSQMEGRKMDCPARTHTRRSLEERKSRPGRQPRRALSPWSYCVSYVWMRLSDARATQTTSTSMHEPALWAYPAAR